MSGGIDRRLARLARVWRRPEPPEAPSDFDPRRLSFAEQIELDALLALVEPPRVGRRPDFSALGDDDLERLDQLDRKGRGLPQDEPWAGMAHRGPEIGPCRCAGRVPALIL